MIKIFIIIREQKVCLGSRPIFFCESSPVDSPGKAKMKGDDS